MVRRWFPRRSALAFSYQLRGPQMQHLPGFPFHRPAHLHHLAAFIDASQDAAFPQPVMQSLLAHRQTLGPRDCLGGLIAGRWIQE